MKAIPPYRHALRVLGGTFMTPRYKELREWIETSDGSVVWNTARGVSYVNGDIYPASIDFIKDEDVTLCLLLFSDIVTYDGYNS